MTGRQSDWLVRQLPHGMLAEDFFVRFVSIFQEEAGTLLQHADNLPYLGDVDLTPPAMVRQLAQWLGRGIDPSYPEDVQRRILRTASETLQWRGTATGLARIVELYSGGAVQVSESGGVYAEGQAPDGPAWVVLEVESTGSLAEQDFLRLVLDEVPAHVHVEVRVADRRIWPVLAEEEELGVMTDLDATHDLTVTCPECGSVAHVRQGQRLASDFCPTCDYPLFWARPTTVGVETQESVDARWRAPGASGSAVVSTLACPTCSELNLPTASTCVRCGADMTPPAPPVEPPPPPPAPVVVVQAPPVQVPCGHPDTWWVVVLTAAATAAITLLLVWWL